MAPYKGAKFYMEIYLDKHLLKQSATFCNITINTTFEIVIFDSMVRLYEGCDVLYQKIVTMFKVGCNKIQN